MDEIRDKNWRDFAEEGDNKRNIHTLWYEVYVKYKEDFINREFLLSIQYLKGGSIFWTCVNNHIIEEKEKFEVIELCGFDYKLFEE